MSAIIKGKIVEIDVTMGDCVLENRKNHGGNSVTGTYFISSIKNFDDFVDFFAINNTYILNPKKILIYKMLIIGLFSDIKEQYNEKMKSFTQYCDYLISLNSYERIDIDTRNNDSRMFMRFKKNNDPIINAFRNILYEDISKIHIEKEDGYYSIYPYINEEEINIKKLPTITCFQDIENAVVDENANTSTKKYGLILDD